MFKFRKILERNKALNQRKAKQNKDGAMLITLLKLQWMS